MSNFFGVLIGILGHPLKFAAFLFAVLLLIHGWWAFTEGDFYGLKGVAVTWFSMLGGFIILAGMFGYGRLFRPPYLYGFLAVAAVLFANTMGWLSI